MAKVLHVLHTFPPETRGGIEHHVEALARAQARVGHEPIVVCGGGVAAGVAGGVAGSAAGADELDGLPVHRLGHETDLERALAGGRSTLLGALDAVLDRERPDVVHVHHFAPTGPGPVRSAVARGARAFVTVHDLFALCPLFFRRRGDDPPCPPDVAAKTCVECLSEASGSPGAFIAPLFTARVEGYRADLLAATRVLAPSPTLLEYLRAVPALAGVALDCIGFPRAGAPAPRGRLRERQSGAPLVVATWGGLVPGKGLGLLVDAATRLPPGALALHHHGPVIDGDHAESCQRRAREGGVPLVLHGPYAPAELAARLADVDVAVQASSFLETYGLTTDEAHAAGLPVVVSDRGAPRERLGGRGVTFRADDAADLARVLGTLLDPERLAALASGAPPDLLAMDEYVERLERVYASA